MIRGRIFGYFRFLTWLEVVGFMAGGWLAGRIGTSADLCHDLTWPVWLGLWPLGQAIE